VAFGGGAACVGLSLGDNALGGGIGLALVHRAIAIRAAPHASFWRRRPAGAVGDVAGDERQHGHQSGRTSQPPDHWLKDAGCAAACQRR
jgi:hypothetical protein